MDSQMIQYLLMGVGILLAIIVILYIIIQRKNKDQLYINRLQHGTKKSKFSLEILYQKLYLFY